MASADFQLIVVPVGSAVLNDSIPDAKTGQEVLREAQALLRDGVPGKEVLVKLAVRWGATEVIQAIAAAMGQSNFVEAVKQGALYQASA